MDDPIQTCDIKQETNAGLDNESTGVFLAVTCQTCLACCRILAQ